MNSAGQTGSLWANQAARCERRTCRRFHSSLRDSDRHCGGLAQVSTGARSCADRTESPCLSSIPSSTLSRRAPSRLLRLRRDLSKKSEYADFSQKHPWSIAGVCARWRGLLLHRAKTIHGVRQSRRTQAANDSARLPHFLPGLRLAHATKRRALGTLAV